MSENAAQDLVDALEILTEISNQQSEDLARSRAKANRTRDAFREGLRKKMEGEPPGPFPKSDMQEDVSRMAGQIARSARREASFMDAFHSLMRLYAIPNAKETAERVFELLRQIREIDVGPDPSKFEEEMPPFSPPGSKEMQGKKWHKLGSWSPTEFEERMSKYMETRTARWDELIEKADQVLAEALGVARTLI